MFNLSFSAKAAFNYRLHVFSPQLCKTKVLPQFVPTLVKFQLGLSLVSTLEDKLKAFDDFKYKQKSA